MGHETLECDTQSCIWGRGRVWVFPNNQSYIWVGDEIINTWSKPTPEATSLIINLQKYYGIYITH